MDTSGGLSQVVADTDGSGNLTALYIRNGGELLAVMRPAAGGTWTTRFVHSDGLGSVRVLTDETGTTIDSRAYEAFGTKNVEAGSDPLTYGFAGEPFDSTSKLAYHRARWMDARVGRFEGMDPVDPDEQEPQSLQRYSYVTNNPVNGVDPSGLLDAEAIPKLMGDGVTRRGLVTLLDINSTAGKVQRVVMNENDPHAPDALAAEDTVGWLILTRAMAWNKSVSDVVSQCAWWTNPKSGNRHYVCQFEGWPYQDSANLAKFNSWVNSASAGKEPYFSYILHAQDVGSSIAFMVPTIPVASSVTYPPLFMYSSRPPAGSPDPFMNDSSYVHDGSAGGNNFYTLKSFAR